jgi:hypothetical protein
VALGHGVVGDVRLEELAGTSQDPDLTSGIIRTVSEKVEHILDQGSDVRFVIGVGSYV